MSTVTSVLQPGAAAPLDTVTNQEGQPVSLQDFRGKKVILFFYPEDNSPTCTKEACNLRDNYDALKAKGFEVIGISVDHEKAHQKFIAKHSLPYTLFADPERKLHEAFGVWAEKKMYGKSYMGTLRTTFVIDEQGIITHVIEKVKSDDHTNQILSVIGA